MGQNGDGGHMINPEIACMYQWTFTEDDNSVHINIPLPSLDFDTTRVHVSLTEGGDTVVVEIPDQIPIVEGTLYATAESHSTEKVGGTLVVNLKKACIPIVLLVDDVNDKPLKPLRPKIKDVMQAHRRKHDRRKT